MRRRWRVNWPTLSIIGIAWLFVWLIVFCFEAATHRNRNRWGHDEGAAWVHSPIHWITPVALAPLILPTVIWLVWSGLPVFMRHIRANPLIYREVQPVLEDLRKVRD